MKILIVEDEPEILELLVDVVDSALSEGEAIGAAGYESALKALKKETFAAVFSDQNMPDGTGGQLYTYLQSQKPNTPFILCSSDSPDHVPELKNQIIFGHIEKPNIVEPVLELIAKIESLPAPTPEEDSRAIDRAPIANSAQEAGTIVPDYHRIRLRSFVKTNIIPCNVYVKLSKKKYVKVLNSNDTFGTEEFDRYHSKKITHLYVKREDGVPFLNNLAKTVLALLHAAKQTSDSGKKISASEESIKTIQEVVNNVGITPAVQELAKANIELAVSTVKAAPEIRELMKKFEINIDEYIASHSNAISYLSCYLLSMMKWQSDSGFYKLSLAAIMHDITLENNDLAAIQTLQELDKQKTIFTKPELEEYRTHPLQAAELVRKMENMPPDVDSIVSQHHERPDSSGFPHSISSIRIAPLSAIFILAHELAGAIAEEKDAFSIRDFLERAKKKYTAGQFRKIIQEAQEFLAQDS